MQALAITEEIEIKPRIAPLRAERADESERWEDRWNGRKNFKKFRRRGAPPVNVRDMGRIIIPLEEAKVKAAGVGDEYWGEERESVRESQNLHAKKSQSKSQTKAKAKEILASEPEQDSDDSLPPVEKLPSLPRTRNPTKQKEASVVISSSSSFSDEEPITRTRGKEKEKEKLTDKTSERGNKRPAAAPLVKGPAKKVMTGGASRGKKKEKEKDDSDSEDELKFRFRRRA